MSKHAAGHKAQRADRVVRQSPATDEIAQFFAAVPASGVQPRLRFVSGICEFNIIGAGTWRIIIKDGMPTVTQDTSSKQPADCVITCAAEDFARVIHREGHINVMAALLQGLLTVTGDLAFATMVLGGAVLEPTGPASIELR